MSWFEILTVGLTVLSLFLTIVLGFVGWIAKAARSDQDKAAKDHDKLETRVRAAEQELAVLKSHETPRVLDGHDARIRTLEQNFTEIRENIKAIRELLERTVGPRS